MRILVLCDRIPSSYRDGLTLRILNYVKQLRGRHSFHLVCFRQGQQTEEVSSLFDRVTVFERPPAGASHVVERWRPEALYPFSQALANYLERGLDPDRFDLVWDAACCLAPHLPPPWQAVPYFGDLVDEMVLALWNRMKVTRQPAEMARLVKYLALNAWFERRYLRPAARCTVVSEVDAAVLRSIVGHDRISVIQNGVDTDYFHPGAGPEQPHTVVFEGSMAFSPNIDAAVFLVREVMPRVRQRVPAARVVLVGRDPAPEVLALAADDVEVTGSVWDVRPFVAAATVFVSPLRFGAGIKNKVLQAWAMGKAIVATGLSISGLPGEDGVNLLVRDSAEALADGVVELLRSPERRRALSEAGRAAVVGRFSWETKAAELEAALESARRTGNQWRLA